MHISTETQPHRTLEQERFEAYRRFEEATDIAERLGYPIDHVITHEVIAGQVYDHNLTRVADHTARGIEVARDRFAGVNAFEVARREVEHRNTLLVEALARGELGGNTLVEVSVIPDEVASGVATIDGYRRDLLRSFVRIHHTTGNQVSCHLFSLDQSDRLSLEVMGGLIGANLAHTRSSRDILADPVVLTLEADETVLLADTMRARYDAELSRIVGGVWHAGSRFTDRRDALAVTFENHDLLDEHMRSLAGVTDDGRREALRRRLAAAIDARNHGVAVGSLTDASVSSQLESGVYGGDCPIGTSTLAQMGLNNGESEEKWMTCPFCGLATYGDPCASRLVCNRCRASVENGRVTSKGIGRSAALAGLSDEYAWENPGHKTSFNQKVKYKQDTIRRRYGEYAELRREIIIGGTRETVRDRRTGQTLT